MHECRRPESGLGNRSAIEIKRHMLRQLNVVGGCKFHKQVMGMLRIYDRAALESLPSLEKLWKTTPRRGPGLGREHSPQHQTTWTCVSLCHKHEPVLRLGFVHAARSALMIKSNFEIAV